LNNSEVSNQTGHQTSDAGIAAFSSSMRGRLGRLLLLWILFFLICFGLGYPTLRRYDPRSDLGLSDTVNYYRTVTGEAEAETRAEVFRCRLLVPYLARPFYRLARARLKTWQPVFFGLLVANALFCATAACLLLEIARLVQFEEGTALFAAALYLLNFAVPNLQLSGMVDASEACMMLLLTWTLLKEKYWLLPLWSITGPLAKETFVPFAAVFMMAWWLAAERRKKSSLTRFLWVIASIILSLATFLLIRLIVLGHIGWPFAEAAQAGTQSGFLLSLWRGMKNHNLWYIFIWLLPLGVWRLRRLPKPWVIASASAGLTAILLGALKDIEGNVGRPLFNTIGPLLTLSAALLLAGLSGKRDTREAED
jgi:uncharacterized membrane protein